MNRINKTYFVYKEKDWDYYWEWPKGEKLRFCGRPKFIIQSLVKLYWAEEAQNIFQKFMQWVATIPDMESDWASFKAATFVLYTRDNKDDTKEFWGKIEKNIYSQEKESWSYGKDIGA